MGVQSCLQAQEFKEDVAKLHEAATKLAAQQARYREQVAEAERLATTNLAKQQLMAERLDYLEVNSAIAHGFSDRPWSDTGNSSTNFFLEALIQERAAELNDEDDLEHLQNWLERVRNVQ